MGRSKSGEGAYEFTRAAYDELKDAEKRYGIKTIVALLPSVQRGVWDLHIDAFDLARGEEGRPVCSWTGHWPNSMLQTFEAFLYSASHRLVRMVEAWAAQYEEEPPAQAE